MYIIYYIEDWSINISLPTALGRVDLSKMSETIYCSTATLPQVSPLDFHVLTVAFDPGILSIDSCSFLLQSINSKFQSKYNIAYIMRLTT